MARAIIDKSFALFWCLYTCLLPYVMMYKLGIPAADSQYNRLYTEYMLPYWAAWLCSRAYPNA